MMTLGFKGLMAHDIMNTYDANWSRDLTITLKRTSTL